jgi:hypothetical protein
MYVTLPDALFLGQAVITGLLGPMGLVQPLPPLVCKSAIYSSTSELLVRRGLLKGNMHAEASVTKSQLRRRVSSAMLMVLQIRQDKECGCGNIEVSKRRVQKRETAGAHS